MVVRGGSEKLSDFQPQSQYYFYLKLHVIMNFKSKENKGGSFQK